MAAPARGSDAGVHIHIEAKHEDRIAIRLEADEVRVDALLTRETRGWKQRYLDLRGASHEADLLLRRMAWQTAVRIALGYCEERLWTSAGKSGLGQ